MYIAGKCNICKKKVAFDIGDMNIEDGIKAIKTLPMTECMGGHMEIGTYGDYYTLNTKVLFRNKKDALVMEVA